MAITKVTARTNGIWGITMDFVLNFILIVAEALLYFFTFIIDIIEHWYIIVIGIPIFYVLIVLFNTAQKPKNKNASSSISGQIPTSEFYDSYSHSELREPIQKSPKMRTFTQEEIIRQREIHEKYGFDFVAPEDMSLSMLETALKNEREWLNQKKKEGIQELCRMLIGSTEFGYIDGKAFENLCADILEMNGYKCNLTRVSGDHGADIIASKNGISYAIQCKCHSRPVGNRAVQEALAGKAYYKTDEAIVLASNDFTKQAIEDADVMGVSLLGFDALANLVAKAAETTEDNEYES